MDSTSSFNYDGPNNDALLSTGFPNSTLVALDLATLASQTWLSAMRHWPLTLQPLSDNSMEEEEEEEETETMLVIVPPEPTISFQESIPGVPTLDESEGKTAMALQQDNVLHYITYLVADTAPADFPGFGAYCPDVCPHLMAAFEAHIVLLDVRQPLFRGSVLSIIMLDDQLLWPRTAPSTHQTFPGTFDNSPIALWVGSTCSLSLDSAGMSIDFLIFLGITLRH